MKAQGWVSRKKFGHFIDSSGEVWDFLLICSLQVSSSQAKLCPRHSERRDRFSFYRFQGGSWAFLLVPVLVLRNLGALRLRAAFHLTFRRYLQKNNIPIAVVFWEFFENLQLFISTEASGNGCWKFSMRQNVEIVGYFKNACLKNRGNLQKKR